MTEIDMDTYKPKITLGGVPTEQGEKPTEPTTAETDEKEPSSESLPEVHFTLLSRSEKSINRESYGRLANIEALIPWHDYTLTLIDVRPGIEFYDENVERIENIPQKVSSRVIDVSWTDTKVTNKIRLPYIGTHQEPDTMAIANLPLELKPFAIKYLGNQRKRHWRADTITRCNADKLTLLLDKYLVATSPEGAFFALVTKSENGVTLAPKDWQRLDPNDTFPPKLMKEIEKVLAGDRFKQINETYYASITDVGLNIFRSDHSKGAAPEFSENTPGIGTNLVIDPANQNIIYYCRNANPKEIIRLDLSKEPNTWAPVAAVLPKKYESINNLQLDPSGNFFLFYAKNDLIILTKDGLEEVKRMPGLEQVNFDASGRIRAVEKGGYLVVYELNFSELSQELDKRRVAKLAEGIKIGDIFDIGAAKKEQVLEGVKGFAYLEPLRFQYEQQFREVLGKITTHEGVDQVRQGFVRLTDALKAQGLKKKEVEFVISGLDESIEEKEKFFAAKSAEETLLSVKGVLAGNLSMATVLEAGNKMNSVQVLESLLDTDLRQEVRKVAAELEQKTLELFRQRGGEMVKDMRGIIERTKSDLEGFTSKAQMDDWLEFRYPQLKSRLGGLLRDIPMEADEVYKAIIAARSELQTIATTYEEKFKREYAKVREKAVERIGATVDILAQDMEGLLERLKTKGFSDRLSAERYLTSSEARKTLENEIAGLANENPDLAKELKRGLKVRISNALTEIERGALTKVAETGQQMIVFGKTPFPKWEAKVEKKEARKVSLIFEEDPKSHGPGVKASEILGDVSLSIRGSSGRVENIRLYEGWQDENDWRLGLLNYRGESISPSYVTAKEFKEIKKAYGDWSRSEGSSLRKTVEEKREALEELYAKRQKIGNRTEKEDLAWKKEYQQKLQEYAAFMAENYIPLLRRIDRIREEPEIEYTNGKGFVPEWQSHWVMDSQTETDLEEMAKALKMQLDLQEGMVNLKGHAGTGKDVRIKMFCNLTNRPYFGIDGTKWTTEFELSEDVMLESKDGASQTVKVPSAVLNGITTPGAVVYFNEFNAMPEQAQIFLHALMDEKRSLTLKTSSGKTIRALPSVLLVGSMNPGYPGTFDPQFATRSRMVSLEIGYPPLTRMPDAKDKNPHLPYDASEALRIARGIDSLADMTYEANLERNEFVQVWDKYINGIDNGAPEPTTVQKFDIDTTLALVQFAHNLRENFIKIFEKSREARNALPVSQPVTGRELRRAAYALAKMTPEEKATANPEVVARELLNTFFLTHIDKKEDRDKVRLAMNTWTSKKRVRA